MNINATKVLILCTGNSARSIMAESLLNYWGSGLWKAYSAGSNPSGMVHPLTLELLKEKRHEIDGLRSKSWDEFATPDATKMDLVITVCDNAAGEVCPIWPGSPVKLHFSFPDPAQAAGNHDERLAKFRQVYDLIETKMRALVQLGLDRAKEL